MKYGWYYEGGPVQDTSEDLWQLLENAAVDASSRSQFVDSSSRSPTAALRVGAMLTATTEEFLDTSDVDEALGFDDPMYSILDVVSERFGNLVTDGEAHYDEKKAKAEFDTINLLRDTDNVVSDVKQWAAAHIEFDPPEYCDGRYPLPISYHEGQWLFGKELKNAAAVIRCELWASSLVWTCETAAGISSADSLKQAISDAERWIRTSVDNTTAKELERLRAFLRRTAQGGCIVSTAALHPAGIAAANADGRMLVLSDGLGFVYLKELR